MYFPSLSSSPIIRTKIEARFETDLLDPEIFADTCQKKYPERHLRAHTSVFVGPDMVVELDGCLLTFELLRTPYPDWHQEMEPEIEECLCAASKSANSKSLELLSLTFDNEMHLEIGQDELGDYFGFMKTPNLEKKFHTLNPRAGKRLDLPEMTSIATRVEFFDEQIPASFTCHLEGNPSRKRPYRLRNHGTWDSLFDGQVIELERALDRLNLLKETQYLIFNTVTTDKCRQLFDGVEENR